MSTRILFPTMVVTMFVLCLQILVQAKGNSEDVLETELEGTWEVVSSAFRGEQREIDGLLWRFQANTMYYRMVDGDWSSAKTFSVNPSVMPAEIEFLGRPGIYELDGNLLRICVGDHGEVGLSENIRIPQEFFEKPPRPDIFESSEIHPTLLLVFRRVEVDDE